MKSNTLINWAVILILIYIGRVQELIPYVNLLSIGKIAVIIVLGLYGLSQKKGIEFPSIPTFSQGKYLIGISVMAVLSIPGSVWPGKSLDFFVSYYLKLLLFVYLLVKISRSQEHLKKLCWGLAFSCFALCLSAIIAPTIVDNRLHIGGTYDPNDAALVLVMALPVIFFLWEVCTGLKKHFLLATMLMSLFVIPQTGSRGGLIALLAVVLGIIAKKGKKAFLFSIPLLGVIFVFFTVFGHENLDRFKSFQTLDIDYNNTAQDGRIQIWRRARTLALNKPLLGSGVGAFIEADGTTHEGGKWITAHNSFLQIAVELGVIGLTLHLWVIFKMVQQARRQPSWLSNGLEVGLYGYCVGGLFLSWAYFYLFYLFIALSLVQARLEQIEQTQPVTVTIA